MKKVTRDDAGRKMSDAENRRLLLDILEYCADICEKNNVRYFLSGGTLLGAIRHKGFIPWDDDIDVNVPRLDCEKLVKLINEDKNNSCYEVYSIGNDPYAPECRWFRIYDNRTVCEDTWGGRMKKPWYHPMFLDVFPVDGYPSTMEETLKFCKGMKFYANLMICWRNKGLNPENLLVCIRQKIAFVVSRIIGIKTIHKMCLKYVTKYDSETSEYVGVAAITNYFPNESVKRVDYYKPVKVEFEGRMYNAPSNYETYLTQIYGNYMELPPIEKRNSGHQFVNYWKKGYDK